MKSWADLTSCLLLPFKACNLLFRGNLVTNSIQIRISEIVKGLPILLALFYMLGGMNSVLKIILHQEAYQDFYSVNEETEAKRGTLAPTAMWLGEAWTWPGSPDHIHDLSPSTAAFCMATVCWLFICLLHINWVWIFFLCSQHLNDYLERDCQWPLFL